MRNSTTPSALCVVFLALSALLGCSPDEAETPPKAQPATAKERYVETGDLPALQQRGKLRILVPRPQELYLPREGFPLDLEQQLAAEFAAGIGLKPVLIFVDDIGDMIPALLEGRGDLIAANITVTESRKEKIAFTVPVGQTREQIVARRDESGLRKPSDLSGRTIAVQAGTSFEETLSELQARYPGILIETLPGDLRLDTTLDKLAAGDIDLTVADSNLLDVIKDYRSDFNTPLNLTDWKPLAWGVRPDNPQLSEALNRFLNQAQLERARAIIHRDDLPDIKKRKTLRLLTRNNAHAYFLWRGELLGFEYELAKRFAKQQGLRLEVIVAPDHESLLPMLVEGQGDIAANFLTPGDERRALGVAFSRPYHYASEVVVGRSEDQPMDSTQDLAGRTLFVRRSSAYWQSLEKLRAEGVEFKLRAAPEDMETEEIIVKVAEGEYDLTVADSHILDIELTWRDDVQGLLSLSEPLAHGWAVRAGDEELLKAIDAFLKQEYRGLFYNLTYRKYFRDQRGIVKHKQERIDISPQGKLSPYDDYVKKYAERYGFDWRLVVAQMYQESRFDPAAKSWAGALGLMQVLPRTAKEFGFEDLKDPETGIHAGVKYLDWVRERFEVELPVKDRMWFALAAYNAGAGHVRDARRLARQQGWDPNRWFDNVERAMLLLSKPKYAKQARHGYVRGGEPVKYVRQIRDRYTAYVRLTSG